MSETHNPIIDPTSIKRIVKRKSELVSELDFSDKSDYNNDFDITVTLPKEISKQAKKEIKKSFMRKSMKLNYKVSQMSEDLHLVNVAEKEKVRLFVVI